jgi:GNAT superfamily N-acetyltransferase
MDDVTLRPLGRPGDLGWVVMAHGELYAAEFGWDATFEALVARIVADHAGGHDPAREAAWIAERGGRRVGCVFCCDRSGHDASTPRSARGDRPASDQGAADERTAQLRVLLVHPAARGHGLGSRLTAECIRFARSVGYERLRLWTTHPLVAARSVYLAAGFSLVGEEPHTGFGVDLVGQTYELDLAPTAPTTSRSSRR